MRRRKKKRRKKRKKYDLGGVEKNDFFLNIYNIEITDQICFFEIIDITGLGS